jgi:hypothetical protein
MVSCLFGRTPDGGLDRIPAVRLHRMLTTKEVYVDLVARTESINTRHGGERRTISLLDLKFVAPYSPSDIPSLLHRKTRFTKIRCTYKDGAPVVLLTDYTKDDIHINSESVLGQRSLWADNVINELVKHITPPKPKGQTEVTDARHKKVYETVNAYDLERQPERLQKRLQDLLDPTKNDFTTHRGKIHWPGLPKTADLIQRLLRAYPLDSSML